MKLPTKTTLVKYGLSQEAWMQLAINQDGRCPICYRKPPEVKMCIDHEHVKGWKRMPPEQRRKYVRGLACRWCNGKYLRRGMTITIANRVLNYLMRYNEVRNG